MKENTVGDVMRWLGFHPCVIFNAGINGTVLVERRGVRGQVLGTLLRCGEEFWMIEAIDGVVDDTPRTFLGAATQVATSWGF